MGVEVKRYVISGCPFAMQTCCRSVVYLSEVEPVRTHAEHRSARGRPGRLPRRDGSALGRSYPGRRVVKPAPPVFLTPKGLEHVGPRAFGYDLDFRSVFA